MENEFRWCVEWEVLFEIFLSIELCPEARARLHVCVWKFYRHKTNDHNDKIV